MLYHYSTSPHYLRMYSSFRGWTSHRPLHWSSDSPQSICHKASRDPLTQHKHPWKFTRHASLIFTSAFRPNSLWWCEILSVRDVNQAWEITHEALIFFLSLSVIVTNGSNWNSSGRTRFHLAAVMNWLRSDSTCIQKTPLRYVQMSHQLNHCDGANVFQAVQHSVSLYVTWGVAVHKRRPNILHWSP